MDVTRSWSANPPTWTENFGSRGNHTGLIISIWYLANGYLGKLLNNARVVRYLAQHHQEILVEFQRLLAVKQLQLDHLALLGWADGDPDPTSAVTAGDAAQRGRSIAVVGMTANPFGSTRSVPYTGRLADRITVRRGPCRRPDVPMEECRHTRTRPSTW